MASPVPAKLQPLHNFSLTHLKWKNNRRSKLAGEASSSSPPTSNPWLESPPLKSHTHASSSSSSHRRHTSPPNASCRQSPPKKQSTVHDSEFEADPKHTGKRKISESSTDPVDVDNRVKKSKQISIRFVENSKQRDAADEENYSSTPMDDHSVPPIAADAESLPKTWNLRPRRLPVNNKQANLGFRQIGTTRLQENKTSREINANKQLSALNNHQNCDTKTIEMPKFSIALSRGEIEGDLLFLTGSKPSKRPKKRPRAVQKQLDNLFPGLWLDSITADSYKVSETP